LNRDEGDGGDGGDGKRRINRISGSRRRVGWGKEILRNVQPGFFFLKPGFLIQGYLEGLNLCPGRAVQLPSIFKVEKR
jgi:hypothetical protein